MFTRTSIVAVASCLVAPFALVGVKEDVQAAAKKLADAPNYSWTTTTEGGFGAGASEGKTQKDGLTLLNMKFGDNDVQIVIKGDKAAIKGQDGWTSAKDAADAQGPARFMSRMAQNFKAPAAQAEDLAGKASDLTKSEDAYAGTLGEEAVKALMARRGAGGNAPQISKAKGTVKFWTKDGALARMTFNVQGTMTINNEDRDTNRTTTIEIKDVGSTKVEIPAEAKSKLE